MPTADRHPPDHLSPSSGAVRHAVRTLFLSDVHLGTKGCRAEYLLEFLKSVETETIVLVGDIIDGWRLKAGWYWPQLHNDVIQKLLRRVRKGARIVYVPGNHDEFLRDYEGSRFGGVEIALEMIHETVDGKRYLVLHGDKFDVVVRNVAWLAHLGDWAYDWAIAINVVVGWARRRLGLPYWSFSGWTKSQVKRAVSFIGAFEHAVATEAARHGVDGVICGHIHHPAMRDIAGIRYVNVGDWVESCTALVEHHDGRMELIYWTSPATEAAPERTAATPAVQVAA
jgi:UDP-2,3-diacylglucosamine pyrophosphatase LpxH